LVDNIDDILSLFLKTLDEEIQAGLGSFMVQNGAIESFGRPVFDKQSPPRLYPVDYERVDWRDYWIHRFEMKGFTLDIRYCAFEMSFEPMLFYDGAQFQPYEILLAAGIPDPYVFSGAMSVKKIDFLKIVIRKMSEEIIENWQYLSNPGPKLIKEALILRQEKVAAWYKQLRDAERKKACDLAMHAFHSGNYAKSIELLKPFINDSDIPQSSVKLYGLAMQRLKV
jgi:hypothetical protein